MQRIETFVMPSVGHNIDSLFLILKEFVITDTQRVAGVMAIDSSGKSIDPREEGAVKFSCTGALMRISRNAKMRGRWIGAVQILDKLAKSKGFTCFMHMEALVDKQQLIRFLDEALSNCIRVHLLCFVCAQLASDYFQSGPGTTGTIDL